MLHLCCSWKPSVQSHCAPHDGCIQAGCAGELLCKYMVYFVMTDMCCVLRVNKCDNLCYSELVALGDDTGLHVWGFGFSHRSDLCTGVSSHKPRNSRLPKTKQLWLVKRIWPPTLVVLESILKSPHFQPSCSWPMYWGLQNLLAALVFPIHANEFFTLA